MKPVRVKVVGGPYEGEFRFDQTERHPAVLDPVVPIPGLGRYRLSEGQFKRRRKVDGKWEVQTVTEPCYRWESHTVGGRC